MKTKIILIILIALFFLGYTGGTWGGAWYLETGNSYFHLVGGFFIALLVASYYANEFGKLSQPFRLFALLGIVMGIGVLWEFHEFALGRLVGVSLQGDLADTIKDLFLDTLGGLIASLTPARNWDTK
ncbi:MAG: hypothetical protein AAB483_00090 [Patescibacteria group bacterium]